MLRKALGFEPKPEGKGKGKETTPQFHHMVWRPPLVFSSDKADEWKMPTWEMKGERKERQKRSKEMGARTLRRDVAKGKTVVDQ
jgi:hypothetical protein